MRRFVVAQDEAFSPDNVEGPSSGLRVEQPEGTNVVGDKTPVLCGELLDVVEGTLHVNRLDRFGWVKTGNTKLNVRQLPSVFSGYSDILDPKNNISNEDLKVHPKMVEYQGRLLATWVETSDSTPQGPLWTADTGSTLVTAPKIAINSVVGSLNWGSPYSLAISAFLTNQNVYDSYRILATDLCVAPDGTLVCVAVGRVGVLPGFESPFLAVLAHAKTFDITNQSWELRSFNTTKQLDVPDNEGTAIDMLYHSVYGFNSVACEYTEGGRLVIVYGTMYGVGFATSDNDGDSVDWGVVENFGDTWVLRRTEDELNPYLGRTSQSVDLCKLPNGRLLLAYGGPVNHYPTTANPATPVPATYSFSHATGEWEYYAETWTFNYYADWLSDLNHEFLVHGGHQGQLTLVHDQHEYVITQIKYTIWGRDLSGKDSTESLVWDSDDYLDTPKTTVASFAEIYSITAELTPQGFPLFGNPMPDVSSPLVLTVSGEYDYNTYSYTSIAACVVRAAVSTDGQNWSTQTVCIEGVSGIGGAWYNYMRGVVPTSIACCVRPDEYPVIYLTSHQAFRQTTTSAEQYFARYCDELYMVPFITRDVVEGVSYFDDDISQSTWFPSDLHEFGSSDTMRQAPLFNMMAFDVPGSANMSGASGDGTLANGGILVYDGMTGVAAVQYASSLGLLIADTQNNPYDTTSLCLYRTMAWQPLAEFLRPEIGWDWGTAEGSPTYPTPTKRLANSPQMFWPGTTHPETRGFTAHGSGVNTTHLDGWFVQTAPGDSLYYDSPLPYPEAGETCEVRAVLRIDSSPIVRAFLSLRLCDDSVNKGSRVDLTLYFSTSVSNLVQVDVYNNAIFLGRMTLGSYIQSFEVVANVARTNRTSDPSVTVFARSLVASNAYDSNEFQSVTGTLVRGNNNLASTNYLAFGHGTGLGTTNSYWQYISVTRRNGEQDLVVGPTVYAPTASSSYDQFEGNPVLQHYSQHTAHDTGVYNYTPQSQCSTVAQELYNGLKVSWRGRNISRGQFDFSSGYEYSIKNIFEGPTAKCWKSNVNDPQADDEIIITSLDKLMYPEGFAMFGRNFPNFNIELLEDINTPSDNDVLIAFRTPYSPSVGGTPHGTHLYSTKGVLMLNKNFAKISDGTSTVGGQGQNFNTDTYDGGPFKFRPHQYASKEGGPKYYLHLDGRGEVYRIKDNTENVLILFSNLNISVPGTWGGETYTDGWSIFSDRCAYELKQDLARLTYSKYTGEEGLVTVAPANYNYCRITCFGCAHVDADETANSIGSLIIGRSTRLNEDIDWGYSWAHVAGSTLTDSKMGARFAKRTAPMRRVWTFGQAVKFADQRPTRVGDGKTTTRDCWEDLVDLVLKAEANNERVALIFEGDEYKGSRSYTGHTQVATDPKFLAAGRFTTLGDAQHAGYLGQDWLTHENLSCVPAPAMSISSVVFEEDF